MSSNPVTCGNCGADNPPGQDFCRECNQPLTGSADQELRTTEDAQDHGSLFSDNTDGVGGLSGPGSPPLTDIGATTDDVPPRND